MTNTKTGRRYSLQDHLSNQMEKRMELEGELRLERAALNRIRLEVQDLDDTLRRRDLFRMGPFKETTSSKKKINPVDVVSVT